MLLQRRHHVGCRQLARRKLRRIKPDPHGVFALAEDDDVAHARDPLQRIFNVNVQVVRDVLVRKAIVRRVKTGGENKVGIGLGDGYAGVLDFLRQPALRGRYAILHVHGRDVQVVSRAEDDVDVAGAVVRTG